MYWAFVRLSSVTVLVIWIAVSTTKTLKLAAKMNWFSSDKHFAAINPECSVVLQKNSRLSQIIKILSFHQSSVINYVKYRFDFKGIVR